MKTNRLNKFFQFLFPSFFIVGIFLLIMGFNDYDNIKLSYKEDKDVRYKVYLKPNNFFETPYLDENRTYISSLIDYIDFSFKYDINYSLPLNGEYKYKFVAIVMAKKQESNEYYWKKEYNLSDEKIGQIKDNVSFSIYDNITVSYDKYNNILNDFKKQYPVASDGTLKVVMRVTMDSKFREDVDPVSLSSDVGASIPLLSDTVDVSIDKDVVGISDVLELKEKSLRLAFLIFKITGFILIFVSVIGFIDTIKNNLIFKRINKYEIKLDKILKNYDSIIANVKSKPVISGMRTIEISEFSELLDVYNEVRMPINYYQDDIHHVSTFIIINDSVAWIYKMKKSDVVGGDIDDKK